VELGYSLPDDVGGAVDLAESTVFGVAQHRVTDSGSTLRDILSRGPRPSNETTGTVTDATPQAKTELLILSIGQICYDDHHR
jgi:hypothetical protein